MFGAHQDRDQIKRGARSPPFVRSETAVGTSLRQPGALPSEASIVEPVLDHHISGLELAAVDRAACMRASERREIRRVIDQPLPSRLAGRGRAGKLAHGLRAAQGTKGYPYVGPIRNLDEGADVRRAYAGLPIA